MESLLRPEDSKRVADALIKKIKEGDLDIAWSVSSAFKEILIPKKNNWYDDWFPQTITEMATNIVTAVYQATKEKSQ